jgi:two-component system sensor histidine kinase RpfC
LLNPSTQIEARHKVLLVDDDAVSLELMAILLSHEGHQVMSANGAEAALDVLATEKADILLVDLQMPGISGGQLARKVRAMEGPNPLLLAMSATEAQRRQLLAFDGFLLKPLSPGALRNALNPKQVSKPIKQRVKVSASCETVDPTVVDKLLRMMPEEALHEVVNACLADTRTIIETIQVQQTRGDFEGVRQSAHRIKGAAAMIGASYLAKVSAGLEVGGNKEAATPHVLDDLRIACCELERMLLAGKFKKTRAPHHESSDRDHSSHT